MLADRLLLLVLVAAAALGPMFGLLRLLGLLMLCSRMMLKMA